MDAIEYCDPRDPFGILAVPLRGEVIESTAAGFLVRNTAAINAPPAKVYTALTDGGRPLVGSGAHLLP